jgi:type II secretory pathway pseudopilin PulG
MLRTGRIRRYRSSRENGYILLTLLLFLALLVIAAAIAAPAINHELKRDREEELVHRGTQYSRAIRNYYRKFGRYPANIEQLQDTNHLRFLRRRYKDPVTGQDFDLLHYGQVRLSNPLGGAGPTLNLPGAPGVTLPPGSQGNTGASSGTGATGDMGGQPIDTTGTPTAGDSSAGSNTQTGSTGPGTGQTFGGGAIIGVVSTSKLETIREYSGKNHYDKWYFVFDPVVDRGALITTPPQPLFKLQQNPTETQPGSTTQPTQPAGTDQNPPQ